MSDRLTDIAALRAQLDAEEAVLRSNQERPWPRRHAAYLHSTKESMWQEGEEIGLSEKACQEFMYALYEIRFDLEVREDGTYNMLAVDGRHLGEKP